LASKIQSELAPYIQTFPKSISKTILQELGGTNNVGNFHTSSLSRLVESVFSGVLDAGLSGEAILHLPEIIGSDLSNRLKISHTLDSNKIYLCKLNADKKNRISFKPLGKIADNHPLRKELFVIVISKPVCALISAHLDSRISSRQDNPDLWTSLASFLPNNIVSAVEFAKSILELDILEPHGIDWLTQTIDLLSKKENHYIESQIWGRFLIDFTNTVDMYHRTNESELNWIKLLTRVQEAVGWELDTEGLFNETTRVFKDTIGYDYLELEFLIPNAGGWKRDGVMKRNETNHGGDLLTLILKRTRLKELLDSKIPYLINTVDDANLYLANPRLFSLMMLKSGILVPLIFSDKPNGLLKIFSVNENHFNEDDVDRLAEMGRILSRSVHNVKTHSDLKRMATVDALTNVFNRRFFSDHINREFDRAIRYNSSLSLIMIDIDHFKHFNDTNGHLAGDSVITDVALTLTESVRGADVVARYGGEEFVVILPETGIDSGEIVAEKVRSAVEKRIFKGESTQPSGNLTISLGLASISESVSTSNELINRADLALYKAKKSGRNRCITFVK